MNECPRCTGEGSVPQSMDSMGEVVCPLCQGTGQYECDVTATLPTPEAAKAEIAKLGPVHRCPGQFNSANNTVIYDCGYESPINKDGGSEDENWAGHMRFHHRQENNAKMFGMDLAQPGSEKTVIEFVNVTDEQWEKVQAEMRAATASPEFIKRLESTPVEPQAQPTLRTLWELNPESVSVYSDVLSMENLGTVGEQTEAQMKMGGAALWVCRWQAALDSVDLTDSEKRKRYAAQLDKAKEDQYALYRKLYWQLRGQTAKTSEEQVQDD